MSAWHPDHLEYGLSLIAIYSNGYKYTYRIHTELRVFTGNKTRVKKPRRSRGFFTRAFIFRKHEGEVCILFKSILIKTDSIGFF